MQLSFSEADGGVLDLPLVRDSLKEDRHQYRNEKPERILENYLEVAKATTYFDHATPALIWSWLPWHLLPLRKVKI